MAKKKSAQYPIWHPNKPASIGAAAYHNAVVNSSWHRENINELIKIIGKKIKIDDVVVDFGAGTGTSAVYLLKHLKAHARLLLVDNSPSWLTYAYDILHSNRNVAFFLLGKNEDRYATLDEVVGKNTVDHVVSANTVHLIPNLKKTLKGIYTALKNRGTFTLQSGNIIRTERPKGILMIDDSVSKIHDIALKIIRSDSMFNKYKKDLYRRAEQENHQRKIVFPNPRPIEYYVKMLRSVGFRNNIVTQKRIKVNFKDWLDFLRVKRLQAGILPEVGGKDASAQEEQDRNTLITKASYEFFNKLRSQNPFANATSFTAEWIYVLAEK